MKKKRSVTLFGSTGSIGCYTVDLLKDRLDQFEVTALVGNRDVHTIAKQAALLHPKRVVLRDPATHPDLKAAISDPKIEVCSGEEAFLETADLPSDWLLSAIVGIAGLAPTYRAIKPGRIIALANKESIVAAGSLFMNRVRETGAILLPVDSEHNAIFQVFDQDAPETIEKIIITASGGPFWKKSLEELKHISPEEAARHPNWSMGKKISIDSATMMNKSLELIEAHYLFNRFPESCIDVLIHPQSIVHAMVAYQDGTHLAHLGMPDMRIAIAHTLAWPERLKTQESRLDFSTLRSLEFHPLDPVRFQAPSLARQALNSSKELIFNAANEGAVDQFIEKKIGFLDIIPTVQHALDKFHFSQPNSVEEVLTQHEEVISKNN